MSEPFYFSFYYDFARQGLDADVWRTLYGNPVLGGSILVLSESSIISYADIVKGDFVFNIKIPTTPTIGVNKSFGLQAINQGAFIQFGILDDDLLLEASDGFGNYESISVPWQTTWTNTQTNWRIKWEAGMASFYVNGVKQGTISDISIPYGPLSTFVTNQDGDSLSFSWVRGIGIQYYNLNTPVGGASTGTIINQDDLLSLSESITMSMHLPDFSAADSLMVEDVPVLAIDPPVSTAEAVTLTESLVVEVVDEEEE